MPEDFSVLFTDISKFYLRHKLRSLGADLLQPECRERTHTYRIPSPTSNSTVLLQLVDNEERVELKVPSVKFEGKYDKKRDVLLRLNDFDQTAEFLMNSGMEPVSVQEFQKEVWLLDGSEIVIQEKPDSEPYAVITSISEEVAHAVSSKLILKWENANMNPAIAVAG